MNAIRTANDLEAGLNGIAMALWTLGQRASAEAEDRRLVLIHNQQVAIARAQREGRRAAVVRAAVARHAEQVALGRARMGRWLENASVS